MKTLRLHIATPERDFFNGDVESVVLASIDGEFGVLADHTPTVVALRASPLKIKIDGEWQEAAISGGFAEINGNRVHVLADTAEWPDEIEVNRAMEAKRRAEDRIRSRQSEAEYMRSMVALQRALTRLTVSEHKKK